MKDVLVIGEVQIHRPSRYSGLSSLFTRESAQGEGGKPHFPSAARHTAVSTADEKAAGDHPRGLSYRPLCCEDQVK